MSTDTLRDVPTDPTNNPTGPVVCGTLPIHADDDSIQPWAYYGTDDTTDIPVYGMSGENFWGAIAVWMTMTTSADMLTSVDTAFLADQLGMTQNAVESIRALATGDNEDAFKTVIKAFQTIGLQPMDDGYPPQFCPHLTQITCRMNWIKKMTMQAPTDEENALYAKHKALLASQKAE